MEAGLPDVDTEYNVEGRAAHSLAAAVLIRARDQGVAEAEALLAGTSSVWEELNAGGGVEVLVTQEMREAIALYVDTVFHRLLEAGHGAVLYVEHRVSLDKLDPPEPMFGTGDAIIMGPNSLTIVDLKYGTGVVVEVKDNPQLKEYALGGMLDLPHIASWIGSWNEMRFSTIIVQPRAEHPDGPVREATYGYRELREFGHALIEGAKAAHDPNAKLTPGPWCRWCKAAAFCPALRDYTQQVAQQDFADVVVEPTVMVDMGISRKWLEANPGTPIPVRSPPVIDAQYEVLPPDPDRLPLAQAIEVLEKAEVVEGFLAAIRERVRHEIENGRDVPGWKLVAGKPVREWVDPAAVERWAMEPGVAIQPEELYEKSMRSPAQIEKIVGKKNLPPELWRKVSKSEKLVRADDRRPALPSSAQKEFAVLPPPSDSKQTNGGGLGDVD